MTVKSEKLELLGKQVKVPSNPEVAELEFVSNPHRDTAYVIRFTCPEFTTICPITEQPDFAHLVIDYVADRRIVESKSLKLFLTSYRNQGAFHEECTVSIGKKIVAAICPIDRIYL